MNHQRKIKAIEKFSEQIKANVDGARLALKDFNKDKPYTDVEIEEIVNTVLNHMEANKLPNGNAAGVTVVKEAKVAKEESAPLPNDRFQDALKEIDYENMTDENWEKYQAIEKTLFDRENYDFERYRARGVFKMKHNDMLVPVNTLVGLKMSNTTALNSTRMEGRFAKDLNAQIYDPSNQPTNSVYYLLKKY